MIKGSVVIFGASSGPADPIVPNTLQPRSIMVSGGTLVNFTTTREEIRYRSSEILTGIAKGWLKLNIHQVVPLAEADKAHRLIEGRQTIGKVILKVADE